MKYNVIAICGKAGSGKDTLLTEFLAKSKYKDELHRMVKCTTRPPREYEIDGKDYHFLTLEDFTKNLIQNKMLEAVIFNNWGYGTLMNDLKEDKINIGIFSPEGIRIICDDTRINCLIIDITAPDNIRLIRQLSREDNPNIEEIFRRYKTDNTDFMEFEDEYNYEVIANGNQDNDYKYQVIAFDNILGSFFK